MSCRLEPHNLVPGFLPPSFGSPSHEVTLGMLSLWKERVLGGYLHIQRMKENRILSP